MPSAGKKHLVIISYYFPPMGGGGVQRVSKFLKYFCYDRFDVTVLTVKTSHFYINDESLCAEIPAPVAVERSGSLDPFRLMALWQRLRRKAPADCGEEEAVPLESSGRLRRMAMSVFVPDSRLLWLPGALLRLYRIHRRRPVDIIFATMPPFTSGLIGALGRRFIRAPLILDFRDAWTANPYLPRMSALHRWLNGRLEKFAVRTAAGLIFVNPALHRAYLEKYPDIRQVPNITLRNGYDPEDLPAVPAAEEAAPPGERRFVLGIMGSVYSQGNRPTSLMEALQRLQKERPALPQEFQLQILGKWAPEFLKMVNDAGLQELIELIPYLPHRRALAHAARFDALTLSIEEGLPGSSEVTPGRIYEYLALKKPILAICPQDSDLAQLVRGAQAGEVLRFGDVAGIARILGEWISRRGELGRSYRFTEIGQFSRPRQAGELCGFLSAFFAQQDAENTGVGGGD